jgi:hypothetical protein
MSYPRFQKSRNFDWVTRVAGNISISSTGAWAILNSSLDLTIPTAEGDVVELGLNASWASAAPLAYLEVATVVANAAVNWVGGSAGLVANNGIVGWAGSIASVVVPVSGSIMYPVQAADVEENTTTFRLMGKIASSTRSINAISTNPLHFWVKNLGPESSL